MNIVNNKHKNYTHQTNNNITKLYLKSNSNHLTQQKEKARIRLHVHRQEQQKYKRYR